MLVLWKKNSVDPFPLTFTEVYSIPFFQAYSTVSTFSLPIHSSQYGQSGVHLSPTPLSLVNIYTQVPRGQLKLNMSKTQTSVSEPKPSSLTILTSSAEGNAILPVAQAKKLRTSSSPFSHLPYIPIYQEFCSVFLQNRSKSDIFQHKIKSLESEGTKRGKKTYRKQNTSIIWHFWQSPPS